MYQDWKAYHALVNAAKKAGRTAEVTKEQQRAHSTYQAFRVAANPEVRRLENERVTIALQAGAQARRYVNKHLRGDLPSDRRTIGRVLATMKSQGIRPHMTEKALRRKAQQYVANPSGYVSDGSDDA